MKFANLIDDTLGANIYSFSLRSVNNIASLSLPLIPFFDENQFEIYNSTGLELPFGKTTEKKIKLGILYTFFLNTVILSN